MNKAHYAIFENGYISFVINDQNDNFVYQETFETPSYGFEIMMERHPKGSILWINDGILSESESSDSDDLKVSTDESNIIAVNFNK